MRGRRERVSGQKGKDRGIRTEMYCDEVVEVVDPVSGGVSVICKVSWIRVRGNCWTRMMARRVLWRRCSRWRSRTPGGNVS